MIRTEISRKFRVGDVAATAARFGFSLVEHYRDEEELFGLLLLRREEQAPAFDDEKHRLASLLRRQRARTMELVESLPTRALTTQHSPLMSPIAWDLGHMANFEQRWLVTAREAGLHEVLNGTPSEEDQLYDPGRTPRSRRACLKLPSYDNVLSRMLEVRKRVLEDLEDADLCPSDPLWQSGFAYRMVAQHEAQHQETILQAIQLLRDPRFELAAESHATVPERPQHVPVGETVLIPGGPFLMGTNDRVHAYDNERPQHWVELKSFYMDAAPVTNGAFMEFIEDGGYQRRELYCDDGWRWLQESGVQAPQQWAREGRDWLVVNFGRRMHLDLLRPVTHVSWYEASAFAKWANKRLPTEAEWEKAAAWNPAKKLAQRYPWGDTSPTSELANLGQTLLEPMAVGAYPRGRSYYGLHQMLGDVWEWTSSSFEPYLGFEAFPYPEYSAEFFGHRYRVLRGGSWATASIVARNTVRNWDFPERRQIFSGFRCARDC
jgi:iron(II)-dependent oxidoreductase